MKVAVDSLVFGSHTDRCAESLYITKPNGVSGLGFKWFEVCNNDIMREKTTMDSLKEPWNLTYSKSSPNPGGRFCITIKSML